MWQLKQYFPSCHSCYLFRYFSWYFLRSTTIWLLISTNRITFCSFTVPLLIVLSVFCFFRKTNLFAIWLNPRFSAPRRNLENSPKISRSSLRKMGPATVVTSTQEVRISPVPSFPSRWCNTYSKSRQKRLPDFKRCYRLLQKYIYTVQFNGDDRSMVQ